MQAPKYVERNTDIERYRQRWVKDDRIKAYKRSKKTKRTKKLKRKVKIVMCQGLIRIISDEPTKVSNFLGAIFLKY